jgi:hypothetical protein
MSSKSIRTTGREAERQIDPILGRGHLYPERLFCKVLLVRIRACPTKHTNETKIPLRTCFYDVTGYSDLQGEALRLEHGLLQVNVNTCASLKVSRSTFTT